MKIEIPMYHDVWMDNGVVNLSKDLYKTILTISRTLDGVS